MEGIFGYVLEYMLTLVSLNKMQNIIFNAQKFKIWGQSILKVILYAYYFIYQLFWPSDRVIDCIQTEYIYPLDYWYNDLDYSNFTYSYKRFATSQKINRNMQNCLLIHLLVFFITWCLTNVLNRTLISLWTHFGHLKSHWLSRNWLLS